MLVKIMNQASVNNFPVPSALRENWCSVCDGDDWRRCGATPTVFFIGLIVYSFDYLEKENLPFLLHTKAIQAISM